MSQNYAVWNDKVKFILTKKYKVPTKYAHKQKGCLYTKLNFPPEIQNQIPMETNAHLETKIIHKNVYTVG